MQRARLAAVALLALAAVAVAAAGLLPLQGAEEQAAQEWAPARFEGSLASHSWDWCTDCHYGVTDVVNATARDGSDPAAGVHAVDVTVRHRFPNVAVRAAAAKVLGEGEAAVEPRVNRTWTGALAVGETARVAFPAAPGDAAAFVQAQADIAATDTSDLALVVEGPGGPWISDGAGALEQVVIPRLDHVEAAGNLTAVVTYEGCLDGRCGATADVTLTMEVYGPGVSFAHGLDGLNDALRFRLPLEAPVEEAPPRVGLTMHLYHDHGPWEQPDEYDASVYRYVFTPADAPPPRPQNRTLEEVWGGAEERLIMERAYRYSKLYVANGNKSTPGDVGAGQKWAHYMPVGEVVPPGTREVEARLEWTNTAAAEVPWRLRLSTGGMLHFVEPAPVEAGNGYAVYRIQPEPHWIGDPAWEAGAWDFGLFVLEAPGETVAFTGEVRLHVVARR